MYFPFFFPLRYEMSKVADSHITQVVQFYKQFHSFTNAYMHLFQSLDLISIDDNDGHCLRRPIQICSLLISVGTTLGQLIRYEMSKVARERDLMIPFITIIFHLYSCSKVVFVLSVYNWHIIYCKNCSCFYCFHAETIPFK